jgi:hypothetical protein
MRDPAISDIYIAEPNPNGTPISKAPKVTNREPAIKVLAPNTGFSCVGYHAPLKRNSLTDTSLKKGKPSLKRL